MFNLLEDGGYISDGESAVMLQGKPKNSWKGIPQRAKPDCLKENGVLTVKLAGKDIP